MTLLAAVLLAAAPLAAAEDTLSGPLPNIKVPPFVSSVRARTLALGAGQSAQLDVQVQNPMFGVGQIFVSCGFDGQADNCLLDTGAGVCLVTNDSFFSKYPSLGQRCTSGASGKKICSDIISIGDLKVGGIDFGKEAAQRRTSDQACDNGGPQLPGYLVGSVWHSLLGHQVAFNFDAKTLSVDSAMTSPAGGQPMKMVLDNTFMLVPTSFGGGAPVQLLYDTGAGLTVLDQSFVDANAGAFTFLADTQIQDSSCEKIPAKVYQVNSLSVAGQSLSGTLAVGLDLSSIKQALGNDVQGIIGFNAITKFNWSVDLKNDTFAITPAQSTGFSVAGVTPQRVPKVLKMKLPSLLRTGN